jgi:hypothetical protein
MTCVGARVAANVASRPYPTRRFAPLLGAPMRVALSPLLSCCALALGATQAPSARAEVSAHPTADAAARPTADAAARPTADAAARPTADAAARPTTISYAEVPLRWKRWALFDPFADRREQIYSIGRVEWNERPSDRVFEGVELKGGERISTQRGPWILSGRREVALRLMAPTTIALGLAVLSFTGNLAIGPLEIGAGPGVTLANIDYSSRDFSLGFLSPRATADAGVRLGIVRLGCSFSEEYLWRWWGRESARAESIMVEIAITEPRQTHRSGHPLIIE